MKDFQHPHSLITAAALLLLCLLGIASAAPFQPSVDQLVDRLDEALGGRANWEKAHYIRFTFAQRRTHHWDKYTGRHRLEGTTRDGDQFVVLSNLNTKEGTAYRNGEQLEGEDKQRLLEMAYGAWINDTYWLLMPYKLRDPGVNLKYDGQEEIDGQTYDKLLLTFESVGLTPGDRYWAYLNRKTGLMDRWAYILERQDPNGPATQWIWSDWKDYGGIKLASGRTNPAAGRPLPLGDIAVFEELPDSVFSSPEPVAQQ